MKASLHFRRVRREVKRRNFRDPFFDSAGWGSVEFAVSLRHPSSNDKIGEIGIWPKMTEQEADCLDAGLGLKSKPLWVLDYPHVKKAYRGKGFGASLYYAGFREAWKRGAEFFHSHSLDQQSKQARMAWIRLCQRFPQYITRQDKFYVVDLKKWFGRRKKSKYLIKPLPY